MEMLEVTLKVWINIAQISYVVERDGKLNIYLRDDDENSFIVDEDFVDLVKGTLGI